MAGNSWGADVAQLRALADEFDKTSDALLRQSDAPGPATSDPASWCAADVARLTSTWNSSHRALIRTTALALAQESRRLLEEANEREKAGNARNNGEGVANAGRDAGTFVGAGADAIKKAGKALARFLGFARRRQP